MWASVMLQWICVLRMDIYEMFTKTLRPFPCHTPPMAIMFPTVEETIVFAGYHTSGFHLQQLAHQHSAYTDLQQHYLDPFFSCVKPKFKRLIEKNKTKYILNFPCATCTCIFVHVQVTWGPKWFPDFLHPHGMPCDYCLYDVLAFDSFVA